MHVFFFLDKGGKALWTDLFWPSLQGYSDKNLPPRGQGAGWVRCRGLDPTGNTNLESPNMAAWSFLAENLRKPFKDTSPRRLAIFSENLRHIALIINRLNPAGLGWPKLKSGLTPPPPGVVRSLTGSCWLTPAPGGRVPSLPKVGSPPSRGRVPSGDMPEGQSGRKVPQRSCHPREVLVRCPLEAYPG